MYEPEHHPNLQVWGPMEEQTQNRPVIDTLLATDNELWETLPRSIRQYIAAYETLLQHGGAAVLIDNGLRAGTRYATRDLPQEHRDRDIAEWVRYNEDSCTALVVLVRRGGYTPPLAEMPRTSSVLVIGDFTDDTYGSPVDRVEWTLCVPGRRTERAGYTADPIILGNEASAEVVAQLRRSVEDAGRH